MTTGDAEYQWRLAADAASTARARLGRMAAAADAAATKYIVAANGACRGLAFTGVGTSADAIAEWTAVAEWCAADTSAPHQLAVPTSVAR